jgi:hypothetical protein
LFLRLRHDSNNDFFVALKNGSKNSTLALQKNYRQLTRIRMTTPVDAMASQQPRLEERNRLLTMERQAVEKEMGRVATIYVKCIIFCCDLR